MASTLTGKVALVTGGSRGIGAAIARRLALEGATVTVTYANAASGADDIISAIRAAGGRASAILADSADPAALARAVDDTAAPLGRLDILVNNAGIAVIKPVHQLTVDDFDRTVAINVRAVFVAASQAARHMIAAGTGGRIITIGSVNADRMPFAGGSIYAMSKAAVAGLTRGLARDLGPDGITVNCIQPGPVATDMNPPDGPFAEGLKALMALHRYARPDEIAAMVAYLAGPEADFITGACHTIDGGFAA